MIKTITLVVIAAFLALSGVVLGKDCEQCESTYSEVRESLSKTFPNLTIQDIDRTAIDGLYEIVAGGNILYYHPGSGQMIFGEIWTKEGKSLTAKRKSALFEEKIMRLPLDKAVKIGDGRHRVIEISDPDCSFCRKAAEFFRERTDVTRYVFFLPLSEIHPEAEEKVRYILCAQDKAKAYSEVMKGLKDNMPVEKCDKKSIDEIYAEHINVGKRLGISGTPTYVIKGQVVEGADIARINSILKGGEAE